MCDPISISMAAVSVASTVASAKGAADAANAQRQAALTGYLRNQEAINVQQVQQGEQASQQASQRALDALKAQGKLAAISADYGAGSSVDRQFSEIAMVNNADQAAVAANLRGAVAQGQLQKAGMRASAQSTINANPGPNPLAVVLQIAGGVVGGYANHAKMFPASPPSTLSIPLTSYYGVPN